VNWLLRHVNVSAHTSLKTTQFVSNNYAVLLPHPPCSYDLASCDFALFPKLKMNCRDDVLKQCPTSKLNHHKRCSAAVLTFTAAGTKHTSSTFQFCAIMSATVFLVYNTEAKYRVAMLKENMD
jgi:hypothetical protein